jgi:uncharacterized protein YcfJ
MFTRLITCGVVTATVLTAPAALADPPEFYPPARGYYAPQDSQYDYARVVNVQPIVRHIRVETPRRECWQETRYAEPRAYGSNPGAAGSMILGAIIGGVIGHQFGQGEGRDISTAAGALIGTAVGHEGARQRSQYAYAEEPQAYTAERCDVRYQDTYEDRIVAYDVDYEYYGRQYHTRLPYDPGQRLRIRVAVGPSGDNDD